MCTYIVEKAAVSGCGKGADGWFSVTSASVAVDHPAHAQYDHALLIDFMNEAMGPAARVAVELSPESGRALIEAIEKALEAGAREGAF
jgi:Family of unknown function (DUF6295)